MRYLIDGYNLLHAMGLLQKRMGPTGLEKARRGLLGLLHGAFGDEAAQVTVVFDAAHAPRGSAEVQTYRGIEVRFAIHHQQADDLIETLIDHSASPRQLTVISDDHRIQKAARKRRCTAQGCGDFLDWLNQHRVKRIRPRGEEPVKPEESSRAETQHWLKEFGDLDNDPDMKELFDPFGFEEM